MKRFCKTCGAELSETSNICSICGSVYGVRQVNETTVLNQNKMSGVLSAGQETTALNHGNVQGGNFAVLNQGNRVQPHAGITAPHPLSKDQFGAQNAQRSNPAQNRHLQNPYPIQQGAWGKNISQAQPNGQRFVSADGRQMPPYANRQNRADHDPNRFVLGGMAQPQKVTNDLYSLPKQKKLPIPLGAIIGIAVGVLALLITAVILIVNYMSVQPMREALETGNGDLASMVYYEAYGKESKIKKYDRLIKDKINEISNSVNSYSFDQQAVQNGGDAVDEYLQNEYGTLVWNPDGECLEECISASNWEAWTDLNTLLVSKTYYCSGVYEYKTESDYESAIADFSNVIADDSGYDNALTMIGECVDGYIDATLAAVDESIANGDISGGMELLNSAKTYLDSCGVESTEIQQKIDETLVTYADSYAQKAEASFKEHDVNGAIGNIEVAMQLQPDNADYKTKYDTYQQYLPFYLYDEDNVLAVEDIDANWIHFDTHSISNDNKEMLHVIALGHNSYETSNIYNIQYNLGGKYDTVTGTIFIADTYKSTIQTSYFEAYGDGKLLYTSPKMEKGMLPQDIWFHVTDIQNLEIKFYTRTDSTLWSSEIGVSNLTAQKDFPA